jgi:hypothetical protein
VAVVLHVLKVGPEHEVIRNLRDSYPSFQYPPQKKEDLPDNYERKVSLTTKIKRLKSVDKAKIKQKADKILTSYTIDLKVKKLKPGDRTVIEQTVDKMLARYKKK